MPVSQIPVSLTSSSFAVSKEVLNVTKSFWKDKGVLLKSPSVERNKDLLCAHSLETRLEELKKAFSSQLNTDFVWALRGGYGFHELLPYLKTSDFKTRKIFMGFSDGTSLHYYLNKSLNQPSLHSPHPNWFALSQNKALVKKLSLFLKAPQSYAPVFRNLKLLNSKFTKSLCAKIVGGNMMTLQSVLGTKFDRGCRGNILFLEEVDEPAYKINRILTHMEQAGFFKGVKAVLFGHLSHESKKQERLILKVVERWADRQKFPVVSNLQVGHIHSKNQPLWLGKPSELRLEKTLSLFNNVN